MIYYSDTGSDDLIIFFSQNVVLFFSVLGGVIEEGNDSDEEDEDGSFEEEEQSEEDTNEGNAVTNDSKDSDVPSANTSENATIKPHDREQGRQSELKCPQINGVSTDEETEKEIRPS